MRHVRPERSGKQCQGQPQALGTCHHNNTTECTGKARNRSYASTSQRIYALSDDHCLDGTIFKSLEKETERWQTTSVLVFNDWARIFTSLQLLGLRVET